MKGGQNNRKLGPVRQKSCSVARTEMHQRRCFRSAPDEAVPGGVGQGRTGGPGPGVSGHGRAGGPGPGEAGQGPVLWLREAAGRLSSPRVNPKTLSCSLDDIKISKYLTYKYIR